MWKRAALLLAIFALAACSTPPASNSATSAPKAAVANRQPPVALAPQAARPAPVAGANGLQGQWDIDISPHDPTYVAVVLIDAQHRATLDAKWFRDGKHGQAKSLGYVTVAPPKVEIILTNRTVVERIVCKMLTSDSMQCRSIRQDGSFSVPSTMTRVGPGPASLMPASR